MAFASLESLCHIIDQILRLDLCSFFPFTQEKIESFQETVVSLMGFLHDCQPICSQRVQDLITEIRDASYEAEDILESLIAAHFLRIDGSNNHQRLRRFPEYSFEQIKERLESINTEVGKIKLDGSDVQEPRASAPAGSLRSAPIQNNPNKLALDKDLEMRLMEELAGGCSKISVIPIVGMAGIGKTTLARILYDSKLIKETFHVRGWSVVSQTYDIQDIVTEILKAIGTPLHGEKNVEQQLYQSLWGRKYLIVLDDVWDIQGWDDVKRVFPDDNNGSRIILTTRDSNVAAYANVLDSFHEMQLLDEDMSWNLLRQEIFLQNNCPPELAEIGKEIARQCQGLPLAICAIGGHLKKDKKTEEYWKYVSENISSVLKTTDDPSLEILTLSYNYLPHYLKACFLYFGSLNAVDHAISVFTLVRMWVAEGFVYPLSNSMEEVAELRLYELIERNLVMVNAFDSYGMPKSVHIHNLVSDICIREAEKEKFLCVLDRALPLDVLEIHSPRRLVYPPYIEEDDGSACSSIFSRENFSGVRSFSCHGDQSLSSNIELSFGLLKVLKVSPKSMKFPVEILELVNLKFLELDEISEIPSSISRLRSLQTLVAHCEDDVQPLPSEIWEMPQLRHLFVTGFSMPDIPDAQGKDTHAYVLKSLQTLVGIVDFSCREDAFTRIPNLKWLGLFRPAPFHFANSFVCLCTLESLHLYVDDGPTDNTLPDFFFPPALKKLVLFGCQIPWEQLTIIGALPNLRVLKLKNNATVGHLWETNDGEFKKLISLKIRHSDPVKWKTEKDHFPCLVYLKLKFCDALEAIPSEIGEIPTFKMIELIRCSPGIESSAKEILEEVSDIELVINNADKV